MDSEATWRATLQEVKRQALLHLKPPDPAGGASGSGGEDWVTVEPPEPQSPVWSERWPQLQWQVAFELLFCHMPAAAKSLRPHQDDLLFFVPAAGGEEGGGGRRPPLLVRRRARQLPAELGVGGAGAAGVDWRASVLLNLVLQTGYCLAVATCRHADLALLVEREGPSLPGSSPAGGPSGGPAAATPAASSVSSVAGSSSTSSLAADAAAAEAGRAAGAAGAAGSSIREVCQVVFASPSRVRVNLDASRPSSRQPEACYPDIAFSVEDFHHAFASVVLTQPDDCYCVLLYAEARDSWTLGGPSPAATASGSAAAAAAAAAEGAVAGQLGALRLQEGGCGGQQAGSAPAATPSGGVSAAAAHPGGPSGEAEQQGAQLLPSSTQPSPESAVSAAAGRPTPDSSSRPAGGGMPLVFSGFVSHQLLADAMSPSMGSGLLGAGRAERTSRVMMRGPGGLGGAEVAVTSKPATAAASEEGSSSSEEEGGGLQGPAALPFIGRLAKGVVKAAKKAAAGRRAEGGAAGPLHLRCALMTLTVPVDMLAASILEAL